MESTAKRMVRIWYSNLNNGINTLLQDGTIKPETTIKEFLKIIKDKEDSEIEREGGGKIK